MSVDQIRIKREAAEARAAERAALLQTGDYYASNSDVRTRVGGHIAVSCESHWDACLVLLARKRGAA